VITQIVVISGERALGGFFVARHNTPTGRNRRLRQWCLCKPRKVVIVVRLLVYLRVAGFPGRSLMLPFS